MRIQSRSTVGALLVFGVAAGLVLTAYGFTIATGKFTVASKATACVRTINTGLTHEIFKRPGASYYWEARGD